MSAQHPTESDVPACRCDCAYVGAQLAGTPIRCERCGGLVDEIAAERMKAVYAESRRDLLARAKAGPIHRCLDCGSFNLHEGPNDPPPWCCCEDCGSADVGVPTRPIPPGEPR